ncbi:MAG TPA: cyclic nucleotide-binding domain-containing protein [Polyangiaceae bacterium]|nr:cyclic nucleotide-binding domain-containing protein [Polyangiaceae bacterium]
MAAETARQRLSRELLFASFARPTTETDDPRSFERLAASVEAQTVRAGDVLFREGEPAEHVYFMIEGRLRLSRPGLADWVYEGWWVIGTTDALAGRPRRRTATIETDTRLSRLPAGRWFEVMRSRPEVLLDTLVGFARGAAVLHAQLAPDGGFLPPAPPARRFDVATPAGRARLLASLPLLRGAAAQVLVELAALADCRELAAGDALFSAGEPCGRAFVVAEGAVEITRSGPDVRATFGPGSLVGDALCLGAPDGAWAARAAGPARVLSFSIDELFDLLEGHHESVRALMGTFSLEQERLREELGARTGELVLR